MVTCYLYLYTIIQTLYETLTRFSTEHKIQIKLDSWLSVPSQVYTEEIQDSGLNFYSLGAIGYPNVFTSFSPRSPPPSHSLVTHRARRDQ